MSGINLKNKQKELRAVQLQRKKIIECFLKRDALIEGSYMEVLQKCGRTTCQCREKPIHLVSRLSKLVKGKLKHKVVKIEDRSRVRGYVENYRKHKISMVTLTKNLEIER